MGENSESRESNRLVDIKILGTTEESIQVSAQSRNGIALDLLILLRAKGVHDSYSRGAAAIRQEITQSRLKNFGKMGSNASAVTQAAKELQKMHGEKLNVLHVELKTEYVDIFGLDNAVQVHPSSWILYDVDAASFSIHKNDKQVSSVLEGGPAKEIDIKGLRSNTMLEIKIGVRPRGGEEWEMTANNFVVWTKAGEVELLLKRNGLEFLFPILREKGYGKMESWSKLESDEVLAELALDPSTLTLFKEILSKAGIVSDAERSRLKKEQEQLKSYVQELAATLDQEDGLAPGTLVYSSKEKLHGVVTSVGEEITVQFGFGAEASVKVAELKHLSARAYDAFISHVQGESQNQVAHIGSLLRESDVHAWIDTEATNLGAEDMCRGVKNSKTFIVYLTGSYFDRYFCRMEAMMAQTLKKNLVVIFESDARHGGDADYVKLVDRATRKFPEFREWILSVEALPMARRAYQRRALINEVIQRIAPEARSKSKTSARLMPGRLTFSQGADSGAIELLTQTVNDLKAEIEDLHAENKLLWAALDKLKQKDR